MIIALGDRRRDHIPYRQSRLTHVLRDSLGGNCHTLMIANIWAEAAQIEETVSWGEEGGGDLWTLSVCCYIVLWHTDVFMQISTLRFATRMMCVSNEPVQNILHDPQVRHLYVYISQGAV